MPGPRGVVGGGRVRKARHVNQGDLSGEGTGNEAAGKRPRAGRAGVRAPIVARKGRNGPGAKGAQEGGDGMDRPKEPDAVPGTGAMPAGDIRARWAWVEA